MSAPTEPPEPRQAIGSFDFWARQNPMLYLVVALIMGGHGLDFVNNTGLRDDVHALSRQLDEALQRLDEQERIDADFRRELDQVYRRLSDVDTRTRELEAAHDNLRLPYRQEMQNDRH